MLTGRFLLVFFIHSTLIIAARTELNNETPLNDRSTSTTAAAAAAASQSNSNQCPNQCSIDYCLQYASLNKNCTKLIRDQCDCCTVCLRSENQTCGGHLNVFGLCEQDFLCQRENLTNSTGICVRACLKYQCLTIIVENRTRCQCAHRRVACNEKLSSLDRTNQTETCDQTTKELIPLKTSDINELINCSAIVCNPPAVNTSVCPSDSHFVEDHASSLRSLSSSLLPKNLTSICCEPRGKCVCSACSKTICGENSIIQIYRTGNPNIPGQCCDQYDCIKNSKQCYHEKKIYSENETWSIDHCTTCTCRGGLVDCVMVQCPTYTHCGYMYKPENECCPKCGGCLDDLHHVQHMNSTWIESNGCMRCWCENGRSRCIAEGCIAPPCENPRQIANVCCPVCDHNENESFPLNKFNSSNSIRNQCPSLEKCSLVCEFGLTRDEQGCLQCQCALMSCPTPWCTLKVDRSKKSFCQCSTSPELNCPTLICEKHCPYNYSVDIDTGCPRCECNPCPTLACKKNCTYGLKRNEVGCPICVCQSSLNHSISAINKELDPQSWPRQCQSGSFSYSSGEIWFDGCRQCLCHKGEQYCALISCPTPKCSKPILLPNRCCPSCPDSTLLPEPIPSSQVCYASQYVTGEELEFDKCTKCLCLNNIAFCSVSICPPLRCSSPIYDSSLCCPICPPSSELNPPSKDLSNFNHDDDDVCLLDDEPMKYAGEVWKQDDCRSCMCPRGGNGKVLCFSQACNQQLPCSNPVLKKGQCCPFCLPPTAAVAVCIFNYVQYRSGEHWNVSDCHHCECSLGTIVCHQQKCPALSCLHTVTLAGHCCPICRDQLSLHSDGDKPPSNPNRFGLTIITIFSILIFLLILIIIILILILVRGGNRSLRSSDNLPTNQRSPILSPHPNVIHSKPNTMYPYVKYDLMSMSNDNNPTRTGLSSSTHHPSTSVEQTSTHSMIGTNTITTGTNSSNQELEPINWPEDDAMIPCGISSSNDGDDEDEIFTADNDESHQGQVSPSQIQMVVTGPPTIIYV